MKLKVERISFQPKCTIGKFYIDDKDTGLFTLEDVVREIKIPGETAIPAGIYKVVIDFSPHFQEMLPRILNVPGFHGVRIHPGNTNQDTEGCILIGGKWNGGDFIGKSRKAFYSVLEIMRTSEDKSFEIEVG